MHAGSEPGLRRGRHLRGQTCGSMQQDGRQTKRASCGQEHTRFCSTHHDLKRRRGLNVGDDTLSAAGPTPHARTGLPCALTSARQLIADEACCFPTTIGSNARLTSILDTSRPVLASRLQHRLRENRKHESGLSLTHDDFGSIRKSRSRHWTNKAHRGGDREAVHAVGRGGGVAEAGAGRPETLPRQRAQSRLEGRLVPTEAKLARRESRSTNPPPPSSPASSRTARLVRAGNRRMQRRDRNTPAPAQPEEANLPSRFQRGGVWGTWNQLSNWVTYGFTRPDAPRWRRDSDNHGKRR